MSAYINRYSMESITTTRNFLNSQPDTVVVTTATEVNNWRHAMANANLQYTFKAGEKISFDADYLLYDNDQPFIIFLKFLLYPHVEFPVRLDFESSVN